MIRRHSMHVASSYDAPPAPVYLLDTPGCEYLAKATGDVQYLYKPIHLPHPLHLRHHLAVSELQILLDAAIAAQTEVILEAWYNEADIVNAGEPDPAYHYRLRTKIEGEPDVICSPDAGFLLNRKGQRTAYYLELERGDGHRGTGSRQLAKRKCPGYAELARHKLYLRHFPAGIDEFRVLLVVLNHRRRDAIRRAFQKKDPVVFRTDLWRFAALTDIKPDTLLHGEIYYRCDDQPPERVLVPSFIQPSGSVAAEPEIPCCRQARPPPTPACIRC